MTRFPIALLLALLLPLVASAEATLRLPNVFGDDMVLQRDAPARVWGSAEPGAAVRVSVAGVTAEATADGAGAWRVELPAQPAGGPHELVAESGDASVRLGGVLFGEVWLLGGQSNMQMTVAATGEEAPDLPGVRVIRVNPAEADEPQRDADLAFGWRPCTPAVAQQTSAVGVAFARRLHAELGVPVGLIHCNRGGSAIAAWLRDPPLRERPGLAPFLQKVDHNHGGDKHYELATHHHAMLAPFAPMRLGGVLWYQGEADARAGVEYRHLLRALLDDWRDAFGDPDLPFGICQLSSYQHPAWEMPQPIRYVELRESQAAVAEADPHAGLIVTYDVGDRFDIHPRRKRPVGERAAAWALDTVYGVPTRWRGPSFASFTQEGNQVRVRMENVEGSLRTRDGGPVTGFVLLRESGHRDWASGRIEGGDTVVLQSPQPVSDVRYAFYPVPIDANLTDDSGLPVAPFRTDDRPTPTAGRW